MEKRNILLLKIIIVIALLLVLIIFAVGKLQLLYDFEEAQEFILKTGKFAPLIIIGLHLTETFIPFFPGVIPSLLSGFLYGPIYGTLLSWFGDVLAATLIFSVARKLGKPWVIKRIKSQKIKNFLKFFDIYGGQFVFISRLIPFLHVDIISIVMSLTNIRLRVFVFAYALGSLITTYLTVTLGSSFLEFNFIPILIAVVLIIFAIIFLYKKKILQEIRKI